MGFFDWLKGTPETVEVLEDKIWMNKKAKLAGISAAVTSSLVGQNKPAAVLLAAHFQDCFNELKQITEAAGQRCF